MGADGTFWCVRAEDFTDEYADVAPMDAGLCARVLLGEPILWAYSDTEGKGEDDYSMFNKAETYDYWVGQRDLVNDKGKDGVWEGKRAWGGTRRVVLSEVQGHIDALEAEPKALEASRKAKAARDWFFSHAETVEVWT